jgi:putative SOS response-associated peptidase YedK
MCTRFFIDESQRELRQIMSLAQKNPLTGRFVHEGHPLITKGEIRPTNVVPVIAPTPDGKKAVYPMKWGFTDSDHGNIIFNARSESAGYKPTFKELWKAHRCVIPSSYYLEWQHYKTADGRMKTGDKYMIQPVDSEVTWLCGLYRIENELPVFVILTCEPGRDVAEIHDRMPVIIPQERISEWITPKTNPAEIMPYILTDMITEQVKM